MEDFVVKPDAADNTLVQFEFPFKLEGKATDSELIETLEDGDILIDGMAVSFDGVDRENENFKEGCLQEGIKSFLDGGAALCYHHKHDKVLGRVMEMVEVPGKGYKVKARVDGAIAKHPELGTIYSQIKNGSLKNFSLGGFFKRELTPDGARISAVDPTELSVTGVPVLANGTQFSVVGGKALENFAPEPEEDNAPDYKAVLDGLDNFEASLDVFTGETPSSKLADCQAAL